MANIESGRRGLPRLLTVTAVVELGAGLTLLAAPAVIIRLLFGSAVEIFPAVGIARLAGAALLSLGAACWGARQERDAASSAIVRALLLYNAAVLALVLFGGLGSLGPLQWTAVALHGTLGLWCARVMAER